MPASNEQKRRRSRSRMIWIGYWIAIFVATHHRPVSGGIGFRFAGADKVVHFVLYFVLTMLGGRYYRAAGRALTFKLLITWVCIYATCAGLDEFLQQFVRRTMSWGDWLADLGGIVAATVVLGLRYGPRGRSEQKGGVE